MEVAFPRNYVARFLAALYGWGNELERAKTGTGLGLFIVRTLVRQLHGRITVVDRSGQPGTVFEVELPGHPVDQHSNSDSGQEGLSLPPLRAQN